jgi:hypothetical protein
MLLRTSLQGKSLLVNVLEHLKSLDGVYDFVRQYLLGYLPFREVIHGSGLHRIDRQFFSTAGGKHDDGARQAPSIAAQAGQHFKSVHIRQVVISAAPIQEIAVDNAAPELG